jgi:hypothetical protein
MKVSLAVVLIGAVLFARTALSTEQDSLQEKISDVSPDKKFAVRTSYDAAIDDGSGDEINSDAIRSVDIIALADKKVVANLSGGESHIKGKILWSADSKWFAYAEGEGHRVTETSVFHWKGDKFEPLNTDEMTVPAGGDARNQYVKPLRWLKPGTLVLNQFTIFYKGEGDSTFEFTVHFDEAGKFHVISRKKVRNKDE